MEAAIAEVKREVNTAQEKTSVDVAKRIGDTSYQFQKKGHAHQHKFNCGIEEAISSELTRLKPTVPEEREALRRAENSLDNDMKQLATRQKHIKIADRLEHGWATVDHYKDDPLASGPEDEKEIDRAESKAEKDVKKEADRGTNKRSRGGGGQGAYNKRRYQYRDQPYWNDHQRRGGYGYSGDRRDQWGPQRPFKPRMLGPCFQCGAYGHIAKFCGAPRRPYPFTQPAGSSVGYAESLPCCPSVDGFEVIVRYVLM